MRGGRWISRARLRRVWRICRFHLACVRSEIEKGIGGLTWVSGGLEFALVVGYRGFLALLLELGECNGESWGYLEEVVDARHD